MRFVNNTGSDRVVDLIRPWLKADYQLDMVSPSYSLFAFAEVLVDAPKLAQVRLVVPPPVENEPHHTLGLLGTPADRAARNTLRAPWLAGKFAAWLEAKAQVRHASGAIPQGTMVLRNSQGVAQQAVLGSFAFSSEGLGIAPGNPLNLIQNSENPAEAENLSQWFNLQWASLQDQPEAKATFIAAVKTLAERHDPTSIYTLMLHHLFAANGQALDEERIVKSATGIRNTMVWKKLYKFQRDGVVGAIDKLERFGGCIIADSVGLGKTFEALAIIKYHELRNDRVLVLAPKRLRDNWTLYKTNDKRNVLAADRLNYDVLNHTDLSRDAGQSGDIDLQHVNWGNYDLVVIDESHNFRNKATNKGRETRYDRLMRKIIREGVKTRVLMLSATPVNNRLNDLKNQIAFVTEGIDTALSEHGIASIDSTTRRAQKAFNRWLDLPAEDKTPALLVEMLGFDYFTLLDHLTIARSRRHIEKYYGTAETGRFPDRLPPINIKADVDRAGEFRSIRDINQEIRRLNLAAYAPLRYVLPHKQAAYDAKYSTQLRGGQGFFRQADREESLIHLLRVNILKRMESAVPSFTLTVQRQLKDVEATLARIDTQAQDIEELDIDDIDIEDPAYEALLVGRKVKVLLGDVDLIRWRQDLVEDRNRLATLCAAAAQVSAARDDKLLKLRDLIALKAAHPINTGNRKIIIFTAFADTAKYLYAQLADWAKTDLGLQSALVTGAGHNQTTLPLQRSLGNILTAFSPLSKERPAELATEGEIDILIATDCISEGQNLQDCDFLVNYDIHWNPVRIIQRFGRIDRLGSHNQRIQLVNFWPNIELEEYINLEQRVSGRMVLLDISATGEENLIEQQSGDPMNDLAYRRAQLIQMQTSVIDLEDLSSGIAITDLTLTDFRIDLAEYGKAHPDKLSAMPLGSFAVTISMDGDIPPGIVFCLRAESGALKANTSTNALDASYPLAPHYLVHVGTDGAVLLPYTQAKRILDRLKRLSLGRTVPDSAAGAQHDHATKHGEDMRAAQQLLAAAVASIAGKTQERAVASLFQPGGTHALAGEFAGVNDFEVLAWLAVLPSTSSTTSAA
jgi:putative intracellular protease/amidase